jgi:hypothetical protein
MNRVIHIDISDNKTRRKSTTDSNKHDKTKKNNNDIENKNNRQSLLKYIHRYNESKNNNNTTANTTNTTHTTKNELEASIDYLSILNTKINDIENEKKDSLDTPIPTLIASSTNQIISPPVHGCLKNGNLPTYRQYIHNLEPELMPVPVPVPVPVSVSVPISVPVHVPVPVPIPVPVPTPIPKYEPVLSHEINKKTNNNKSTDEVVKSIKKTIKRTYKLGKIDNLNTVSVLVANKTRRNEIAGNNKLIKRTPIHTIRQYLVKCGLIKYGSPAPPEILRQMFESVKLMGCDLQNHNSEIYLYNYIHNEK